MSRIRMFGLGLSLVFAANAWAAQTWHVSTIRSVYPLANGTFILTFTTDSPHCTNANSPHYYLVAAGSGGVTADAARNMYALALTAAASSRSVTINFESSSTSCYINRMAVNFT